MKYLAQLYCIAPEYAQGVYDLLLEKKFGFAEVQQRAKTAEVCGKEEKFIRSENVRPLAGMPPSVPVYGV